MTFQDCYVYVQKLSCGSSLQIIYRVFDVFRYRVFSFYWRIFGVFNSNQLLRGCVKPTFREISAAKNSQATSRFGTNHFLQHEKTQIPSTQLTASLNIGRDALLPTISMSALDFCMYNDAYVLCKMCRHGNAMRRNAT